MVGDGESFELGHSLLALLDFGVVKLFHLAAVQADNVVVVLALVEFVDRLAAFKLAARQDAGLFKLGEYTVDGGQAHIRALLQQDAVHVFRRHMALATALENFEDFQAGNGGFEPSAFEFVDVGHGVIFKGGQGYNDVILLLQFLPMKLPFSVRRCMAALGLVSAAMALMACSSLNRVSLAVPEVITPYRMDIVQGNVVTREQLAALQIGMPRQQVQAVLGTPLLTSPFHAQRWDYTFTLQRQGVPAQDRHLTVWFKDDLLERIEADALPSEADFVGSLRKHHDLPAPKPLQASEADLAKVPPAAASKSNAPALPLPGATSYPPLELTAP